MRDDLEQKIVKDFPEFFKDKKDIQRSLMSFGFSHDDGWFDIVYQLTKDIKKVLNDKDEFQIVQVKEKFAGLRYYFELTTPKDKWDKYSLPFRFNRLTKFKVQRFLDWIRNKLGILTKYEIIDDIVKEAENKTYRTCEICGAEGKVRNDLGWIKTLCINHYKETLARRIRDNT
jgi:hypothetical protein